MTGTKPLSKVHKTILKLAEACDNIFMVSMTQAAGYERQSGRKLRAFAYRNSLHVLAQSGALKYNGDRTYSVAT